MMKSSSGENVFTRLYAKIQQEDGAYTISVRLQNESKKSEVAWGQETAPSIEAASAMIGDLAAQFSIPKASISIAINMENSKDGTLH